MYSRELLKAIFAGTQTERCGFWLGQPDRASWPLYFRYFQVDEDESLRCLLGDDFRWIVPGESCYEHPEGKPIFEMTREHEGLSAGGPFAHCESVSEVEAFPWPDPDYLDFTETLEALRQAGDYYRASGMWSCFFHNVADFFGMDNYFVKMYTNPDVVEAVTKHVCEFYLEANRRLFEQAGGLIDGFFFGNDFGTQRSLLISPGLFDRFVMPWFRRFTNQAHTYGLQAILHSCGAIHEVIGRLIDAGVDVLHPLQAKAEGMDAETLARDFGGRIAFLGGIDTQELLIHATPAEVEAEVYRVKRLLGPSVVISPSHEALLPNVPPENVEAMARAVREW